MKNEELAWLKHKGYPHLMPQIDIVNRRKEIVQKVTNQNFVKTYAFFPLIHSVIKERKYKKIPGTTDRAHSYKKDGKNIRSAKERPLHYSSHMDALIFGYYADLLQKQYEDKLAKNLNLSECIIAYRRIPTGIEDKNKSTIHFAKEVFDKIKEESIAECSVLMFDIKSFFSSLDHTQLKEAWENIIGITPLPPDHKNVFKAATRFSYILKDELRLKKAEHGRRSGFDESRLSEIRKAGKNSFFDSPKEFREAIKNKLIKIYKNPFTSNKIPIGIPQGLAISAVLANIYLYNFDQVVFEYVVTKLGGFYRRYSDDILIICKPHNVQEIKAFVINEIKKSKVRISEEKTEEYLFKPIQIGKNIVRITSIKVEGEIQKIGVPLTYLGFEFYGEKTLIKSANLAKFYRRMKHAIRTKAKRAKQTTDKSPLAKYAVYRSQLKKLYTIQDLNKTKVRTTINRLVKNERGYYDLKVIKLKKPLKSNYLSYVRRASVIMEDESIENQIRNHEKIFNETIHKHLKKNSQQ